MAIDDLEEETEVLLKPLGFPLNNLSKVIGAAIRPDGSVQMVLDLANPAKTGTAPSWNPLPKSARLAASWSWTIHPRPGPSSAMFSPWPGTR